jgi:translation initiation factor 2B subunit (eIF-2B alpha/beta/delta family)
MSSGHPPLLRSQDSSDARDAKLRRPEESLTNPATGTERVSAGSTVSLSERLAEVSTDRAACARAVVQETSSIVAEWLRQLPDPGRLEGVEFERHLVPWAREQAWRGPCALWLDSVRMAWLSATESKDSAPPVAVAREAILWSIEEGRSSETDRRLPSRTMLAARAGSELDRGEVVLVTAWSETVALAIESAWRLGKRPEVLIGEGSPGLDARRMAQRLARGGIPVTMTYDAALVSLVPRADRLWLSSEAIGAGAFLGRRGTRCLLEECARREVPTRILATSDKLIPGGELRAPPWAERETWLLWEDAPEGVQLDSQCFEPVPLELTGALLTERGPETASSLHLRALRVEAAPPSGSSTRILSTNTP